jgi:hypothetical protein
MLTFVLLLQWRIPSLRCTHAQLSFPFSASRRFFCTTDVWNSKWQNEILRFPSKLNLSLGLSMHLLYDIFYIKSQIIFYNALQHVFFYSFSDIGILREYHSEFQNREIIDITQV